MKTRERFASPLSQRTVKPQKNFISIKIILFVRTNFCLFPISRKTTSDRSPRGPPYKEMHKNHQDCFKNMRRCSQKNKHYSINPELKGLTTHTEPLLSHLGRDAGWVQANPQPCSSWPVCRHGMALQMLDLIKTTRLKK